MVTKNSFILASLCLMALATMAGCDRKQKEAELGAQVSQFTEICVDPVLAGKSVGEACRSLAHIRETYDLDIAAHIENRRARMAKTARGIVDGTFSDPLIYKACIARGDCEDVPLLPPDVDTSDPKKLTKEQQAISAAFWDLAEKDKMTSPVCDLIPECRAMVKLSVIDYGF